MSEVARRWMSVEEFFEWQADLETRYELVDGQPVAMAGANQRHERIVTNALFLVIQAARGRGGNCRPFTADTAVAIPSGNIRYPDLGMDCGPFVETSMTASEPRLVIEVLSPSTARFDEHRKSEEYRQVSTLTAVLIVDYLAPRVLVHERKEGEGWTARMVEGLDGVVEVADLGVSLPLAELYRDLTFRPRPVTLPPPDPGE